MTEKINLVFSFESDATPEDITDWVAKLLPHLPDGTEVVAERPSEMIGVDELTEKHKGKHVIVNRDKDKRLITGKLNAFYPEGESQYNRVLIVDGRAHSVHSYEVVQVD